MPRTIDHMVTPGQEVKDTFRRMRPDELNDTIRRIERAEFMPNDSISREEALRLAYQAKGAFHRDLWNRLSCHDARPHPRALDLTPLRDLELPEICREKPRLAPAPWQYSSADELAATCPWDQEIRQIRADFNIYFERGLIDHGVLKPWSCTNGGRESSIMLSMYTAFRLLRCIPFDADFPWAPGCRNLYDWLKGLNLIAIGFFWANPGEMSYGWDRWVHLIGNYLGDPIYRDIINPQAGVGIIYTMVLLVHEARHAGTNIPHNCGYKDTNLAYMGAWAVQYYLLRMLAENTGSFFSTYERQELLGSAQNILNTRFCQG